MKISKQELPGKVGKVFRDNCVCVCLEHREEANTEEWNEDGREWAGRGQSSGGGQTLGGLEERRLGLSL